MSFRNQLLAIVALLLVVSAVVSTWLTREPEPVSLIPATVERDCAPWDGPAFTVSVPVEKAVLKISIYRSPDIRHATRFSFPDESLREGHALLLLSGARTERLTGRVSFQRVEQGVPVEGKFALSSEAGRRYRGRFRAEWGNEIVYCG